MPSATPAGASTPTDSERSGGDSGFAAVSHWADEGVLEASETTSAALRERVANAIAGTSVERVSTSEIILVEMTE